MSTALPLIPVIDLKAGRVVHALRGERQAYQPLDSPLCPAGDPFEAVSRMLQTTGGDTLYLADLDALMGRQRQTVLLRALLDAHPSLRLWLDAGYVDVPDGMQHRQALTAAGLAPERVHPVWASETLRDARGLKTLPGAILSLDQRGQQPLDALGLAQDPTAWPDTVILMGLERVGARTGPDLSRLAQVRAQAPGTRLVGAGGLRDAADADRAQAAGASAWLVATALHEGHLGRGGVSKRRA